MPRFFFVFAALLYGLLAACAPHSPNNYTAEDKVTRYAYVGEVRTVRSGDSIMHYQTEVLSDSLVVPQNLSVTGLTRMSIPAGVYPKTGEDSTRVFFSRKSTRGWVAKAFKPVSDILYYKADGKLTVNLEVYGPNSGGWTSGFRIESDARIKVRGEDVQVRSLSYGGSSGKLVTFVFKEGRNTQRITHNMADGNIFRYQGGEVEIVAYDSKSLTCKVLKEMDLFLP